MGLIRVATGLQAYATSANEDSMDGRHTTVPDDALEARGAEDGVQRGDGRVEALSRQVDGAFDGATLQLLVRQGEVEPPGFCGCVQLPRDQSFANRQALISLLACLALAVLARRSG